MRSQLQTTGTARFFRQVFGLAFWLGVVMFAFAQSPSSSDPLPVRRVIIPPSRLPAELDKAKQGVLVQIPRAELEDRLAKAAVALEESKNGSRLIQAHYTAEVQGSSLVRGTGSWKYHHAGTGSALVGLPQFNLAMSKLKNEAGADAVLGEVRGHGLRLFLEKPGVQMFYFDWSLRGAGRPDGILFDLQLPPSPRTSLELKMPAEHWLQPTSKGVIAVGPFETEHPAKRLWRLQATGHSQVEFIIRPKKDKDAPSGLLVAQVQSKHQLVPESLTADFDWRIEALHTSVTELVFDCPAGLEPYEVTSQSVEVSKWEWRKSTKEGEPGALRVQFRQPIQGAIFDLRMRCLSALALGQGWTAPWMRLRGAWHQDENMVLHLHPELHWRQWTSGAFAVKAISLDRDGGQVLTLVRTRPETNASDRPGGIVAAGLAFLHARIQGWTILTGLVPEFFVEIDYGRVQGGINHWQVQIPPGWSADQVRTEPKELLAHWAQQGQVVHVDLTQSVKPGTSARLGMRLHPPKGAMRFHMLDLPDVNPLDATVKEGQWTLAGGAGTRADIVGTSGNSVRPTREGPWYPHLPLAAVAWRGAFPGSKLLWQSPTPLFGARIRQNLRWNPGQAELETTLDIEPRGGPLESVDLHFTESKPVNLTSADPSARFEWERLAWREPLPALLQLGAANSLAQTLSQQIVPQGEFWRMRFLPPLTKAIKLSWSQHLKPATGPVAWTPWIHQVVAAPWSIVSPWSQVVSLHSLPHSASAATWRIPLVSVMDAPGWQGELRWRAQGMAVSTLTAHGARPYSSPGVAQNVDVTHASAGMFSFGGSFPQLALQTLEDMTQPAPTSFIYRPHLLSTLELTGRVVSHFRFQLWHWREKEFAVELPTEVTEILAVRVNGKWLERPPLSTETSGLRVTVPINRDHEVTQVELLYASEPLIPANPFVRRCVSGSPRTPVALGELRRTWRLPSGMVPLHAEKLKKLDLPNPRSGALGHAGPLASLWHGGDQFLGDLTPWSGADENAQRQLALGGESAWRRRAPRDVTLGEALEQLLQDYWKEQTHFLVDREAFTAAGLGRNKPLPPLYPTSATPFWESLNIIFVPFPGGGLFTTQGRWQEWSGRFDPLTIQRRLAQVSDEVGRFDQDESGSLCSLVAWLYDATEPAKASPETTIYGVESAGAKWTEWTALHAAMPWDELTIVSVGPLRWSSQASAFLLLLLGVLWAGSWSRRWRFRLMVVWLAVCAYGVLRLPESMRELALWPGLAGLACVLFWWLRSWFTAPASPRQGAYFASRRMKVATGAGCLVFLLAWIARAPAGGQDPFTILLLPAIEPEKQVALVVPELLHRLEEITKKVMSPSQDAILVQAQYQGKDQGALTSWEGRFELFSFTEQAELTVPLGEVELQEGALLNGAPVFPQALPGQAAGYRIRIPGKGWHRLTLAWTARPRAAGGFQETLFSIPPLPQSHLELNLPQDWGPAQLVQTRGDESWQLDTAKTRQVLRAHLGRATHIHARWRTPGAVPKQAAVEAQEAYLWDLKPGDATLTATWTISSGKSFLPRVVFSLPEELAPRSVEAYLPAKKNVLQTWSTLGKAGERHVVVEFSQPISGEVEVTMQLAARPSPGATPWTLRLPQATEVKTGQGILAYRIEGGEATEQAQNLAVTSMSTPVFSQLWTALGHREPGNLYRSFGFRRTGASAGLVVTIARGRPEAHTDLRWNLFPLFAEFSGTLTFKATDLPLSLLEWTLPAAVSLNQVTGPHVQRWRRQGTTVQVWLQESQQQTSVKIRGFMPWALDGNTGPNKNPALASGRPKPETEFALPALRISNTKLQSGTIILAPKGTFSLEPKGLKGLVQMAGAADSSELIYRIESDPYDGKFLARQLQTSPELGGWMRCLLDADALYVSGRLQLTEVHENQPAKITVRQFPADDLDLVVLEPNCQVFHRRRGDDHEWTIRRTSKEASPLVVYIHGHRTIPSDRIFSLPQLKAENTATKDLVVSLSGIAVKIENSRGLEAMKTSPKGKDDGVMNALAGDSLVWKVTNSDWQLQVQALLPAAVPRYQILLREHHSILNQSLRWHYLGVINLFLHQESDLLLQLPAGAVLDAAACDEQILTPRFVGNDQVYLTLTDRLGPRRLQLRWHFKEASSSRSPNPAFPQVQGLDAGFLHGKVWAPPGYELGIDFHSNRAQENWLQQAQALVRQSALLAEGLAKTQPSVYLPLLTNNQKRFHALCRQADAALARMETGILRTSLEERWSRLREENVQNAGSDEFKEARQVAEKNPSPSPENGHPAFLPPIYGQAVEWWLPDQFPFPRITAVAQYDLDRVVARRLEEITLLVALALILVSLLPGPFAALSRLWPEMLVLAGLAGSLTWGISLIGLALMTVGGLARTVWCLARFGVLVRSWSHAKIPHHSQVAGSSS